jgi:hypothetical protein
MTIDSCCFRSVNRVPGFDLSRATMLSRIPSYPPPRTRPPSTAAMTKAISFLLSLDLAPPQSAIFQLQVKGVPVYPRSPLRSSAIGSRSSSIVLLPLSKLPRYTQVCLYAKRSKILSVSLSSRLRLIFRMYAEGGTPLLRPPKGILIPLFALLPLPSLLLKHLEPLSLFMLLESSLDVAGICVR